jgi:CrcB protein
MGDLAYLIVLVALGSAAGGIARFAVSGQVARRFGETFPWGTMMVNVTGAFAIGFLSAAAQSLAFLDRPEAWLLAVTGFLGSYTTVSSFSLQTLALVRDGEIGRAAGNILLTLCLCLLAVAAGAVAAPAVLAWLGA